jgi:hypothetical protein
MVGCSAKNLRSAAAANSPGWFLPCSHARNADSDTLNPPRDAITSTAARCDNPFFSRHLLIFLMMGEGSRFGTASSRIKSGAGGQSPIMQCAKIPDR